MKPFIVLIIVFALSVLTIKLIANKYEFSLAANIAMCVMLAFTSIGHFKFTNGMRMMIPRFIPFKTELVYLTGVLEVLSGIGLLIPEISIWSARVLILFFICLLPANINAAIKHIDYEKANYNGKGISYLWFRIPLQIVFIVWTFMGAIKIW